MTLGERMVWAAGFVSIIESFSREGKLDGELTHQQAVDLSLEASRHCFHLVEIVRWSALVLCEEVGDHDPVFKQIQDMVEDV